MAVGGAFWEIECYPDWSPWSFPDEILLRCVCAQPKRNALIGGGQLTTLGQRAAALATGAHLHS
jgi:hypothetical protein